MRNDDFTASIIEEALDSLHAPEDVAERAMSARAGTRRRRGHAPHISVVAIVLVASLLACGGTAYAIANSGFFSSAYGNHGLDDSVAWNVQDSRGNAAHTYHLSFDTVSAANADASLAEATEQVGLSTSIAGYTLTVDTLVLDANGIGAATFTLSNPDGIRYKRNVSAYLLFDEDSNLSDISMRFSDNSLPDYHTYYDADTSTDTEVHGTVYFAARDASSFEGGVRWMLSGADRSTNANEPFEAYTDSFTPSKALETRTFSDGSDYAASISPVGIRLTLPSREQVGETVAHELSLTLADGSERTIIADRADGSTDINYYVAYGWDTDDASHLSLALAQVAEPFNITQITLGGNVYQNDTRQAFSVILTPID